MVIYNSPIKLSTKNFIPVIRFLASLLIFVVLIGFLGGIVKTFFDLKLLLSQSLEVALQQMLVNVLNLLAVIEVLKTALSYLTDGRVRVTYIVDTVLIVMLNEIIVFWFKGDHTMFVPLVAVLATLIAIRILAIKFSPDAGVPEE